MSVSIEAHVDAPYAIVEPDAATWDAFVLQHPQGGALQSSAWGELKRSAGWRARLVAVSGPQGIVAGAMVLLRSKYGVGMAYTPRGPLFAGDEAANMLLLKALERVARSAWAVLLRLEPNVLAGTGEADRLHTWLMLRDYRVAQPIQPRSSVHLDVSAAPERLLAAMSKGHRADIRRAAREGVEVTSSADDEHLRQFYAILSDTARRAEFGIHQFDYYRAVLRLFGDAARVWLAVRNGEAEAAALTLGWGRTALYLYSGSTADGLKSGAQHAIQWEVIQWAHERGCLVYDFWGIPDKLGEAALVSDPAERARLEEVARMDPLYGVYRFKKGFGGMPIRYLPAYDLAFVPALYEIVRRRLE